VNGTPIPIYGLGNNRREWMPVEQHVDVIMDNLFRWLERDDFLASGTHNVAGGTELSNMELVNKIHHITTELGYRTTMEYVADRKGHDFRYAMKGGKNYQFHFDKYLLNTVRHYIDKYEQRKEQVHSTI
jgi:dTDP-glucose 4,6-dehydratase